MFLQFIVHHLNTVAKLAFIDGQAGGPREHFTPLTKMTQWETVHLIIRFAVFCPPSSSASPSNPLFAPHLPQILILFPQRWVSMNG